MSGEKKSPSEPPGKWESFWQAKGKEKVAEEAGKKAGRPLETRENFNRILEKTAAALAEIGGETESLSPDETIFRDVKKTILDQLTIVKESLEANTTDFQYLENLREYIQDAAAAPRLNQTKEQALLEKLNSNTEIQQAVNEIMEISKSKIETVAKTWITIFLDDVAKNLDQELIVFTSREEILEQLEKIVKNACKENTVCDETFANRLKENFAKNIDNLINRAREIAFKKSFNEAADSVGLNDLDKLKKAIFENLKIHGFDGQDFSSRLEQEFSNDNLVNLVGEAVAKSATNTEVANWLSALLTAKNPEQIQKEINEKKEILELTLSLADLKSLEWVILQKRKIWLKKEIETIGNKVATKDELTKQELILIFQEMIDPQAARQQILDLKLSDEEKSQLQKFREEITRKRTGQKRQDLAKIFDCDVKQVIQEFNSANYRDIKSFPDLQEIFKQTVVIEKNAIFNALGITFLNQIKFIGGNAVFFDSLISDLGQLQCIGRDAEFSNSQIENLGQLQTIGHNANFKESKVKDLGQLQTVGGDAKFANSQIENLGQLQTIGGSASFGDSKIKSLGQLRFIGGHAYFYYSKVESLGQLETIGGNVNFSETPVKNLGQLQTIGGDANFENSSIENLGQLKRIGGGAAFRGSALKSLGRLESINGSVNFRESLIEDLGSLQTIGGEIHCSKSNKKLFKELEKRFGTDRIIVHDD